jgi:hypothetical protein
MGLEYAPEENRFTDRGEEVATMRLKTMRLWQKQVSRRVAVARVFKAAMPATLQKQTEPENQVNSLVAGMSPELQKEYAAAAPPKDTTKDAIALHVTMKAPPAAVGHTPLMAHATIEMHVSLWTEKNYRYVAANEKR